MADAVQPQSDETILTIAVGQLELQAGAAADLRLWVAINTHGVTEPLATERMRPSAGTGVDFGFRQSYRVAHGGPTHEALLRLLRHSRLDDSVFAFTLHGLSPGGERLLLGSVAVQLHVLVKARRDVHDQQMLLHVGGRVTGSLRVSVGGVARLEHAAAAAAACGPQRALGGAYSRVSAGSLYLQLLVSEVAIGSEAWEAWESPPDSLWVEADLSRLCGLVLRTPAVPVSAQRVAVGYEQTVPLEGPDGAHAGRRLAERLATEPRAAELAVHFRVWAVLPGAGVRCIGVASLSPLGALLNRADLLGVALSARPPQRVGGGAAADGGATAALGDAADALPAEADVALLPQSGGPTVAILTVSLVALDALRTFSRRAALAASAAAPMGAIRPGLGARGAAAALLSTAYAGDVPALRALLARGGSDVNRTSDDGGHTPLHWAAANGHADAVAALLGEASPRADAGCRNLIGCTPLHLAAAWGRTAAARALLLAGAPTDARTLAGKTPGDVACAHAGDARARAQMRELLAGGAERARLDAREEALTRERERGAARVAAGGGEGPAASRIQG